MTPLPRPILCLVTSGEAGLLSTLDSIRAAAQAGVSIIQIREHLLDDRALVALVGRARGAVAGTRAQVVVNERVDIALAAGAAGVHLRERSMPASRVRPLVRDHFLIGRSVHSVESARAAERDGACDYLVFGTVFLSESKPPGHPVAGLDQLRLVCAAVALPVVAIGGVTEECLPDIASAGAAGVAAITLFRDSDSAARIVAAARGAFDTRC